VKGSKGQLAIPTIIAIVIVVVIVASIVPIFGSFSTSTAIQKLEGQGYVVFAAGEYSALVTKVDSIATKADAAVLAAQLASANAQDTLNLLRLHTENENYLFPETTAYNITLTAPATADTWSAWTEVVASNAETLSSKFAADTGYLSQVTFYGYNFPDELIIVELAYDDDGTDVVGRVMARSDFTWVLELNSEPIPAGSTVYYRMMSSHINESIKANFKYYYN